MSTEDTVQPEPAPSRPADRQLDADAAWGLLVRVSTHQNIKVRTLAEAVIPLMTSPVPAEPSPATSAPIRYLLPRGWPGGGSS